MSTLNLQVLYIFDAEKRLFEVSMFLGVAKSWGELRTLCITLCGLSSAGFGRSAALPFFSIAVLLAAKRRLAVHPDPAATLPQQLCRESLIKHIHRKSMVFQTIHGLMSALNFLSGCHAMPTAA